MIKEMEVLIMHGAVFPEMVLRGGNIALIVDNTCGASCSSVQILMLLFIKPILKLLKVRTRKNPQEGLIRKCEK